MSLKVPMEIDYTQKLTRLLNKPPKKVHDYGCTFYTYYDEGVNDKKVISLSFWKGSPGYLFSLQTSILEWVRLREKYYTDWYIRFYIDVNVFQPFSEETMAKTRKDLYNSYLYSFLSPLYCALYDNTNLLLSKTCTQSDWKNRQYDDVQAFFKVAPKTPLPAEYVSKLEPVNDELLTVLGFDRLLREFIIKHDPTNKSTNDLINDFITFVGEDDTTQAKIKERVEKLIRNVDTPGWFEEALAITMKHKKIELWFYDCQWGKCIVSTSECSTSHLNTFGSLVRFHPFVDKNVKVVVVRNVEYLSSKFDKYVIDKWLESRKPFCIYAFSNYICRDHLEVYRKTCLGLDNHTMILATINYNKEFAPPKSEYYDPSCLSHHNIMRLLKGIDIQEYATFSPGISFAFPSDNAKKFAYGIDEVILTLCIKPYISENPDSFYLVHMIIGSTKWIKAFPNVSDYEKFYTFLKDRRGRFDNDEVYEEMAAKYRQMFANNEPKTEIYESTPGVGNARYFLDNTLMVKYAFPGQQIRFKSLYETVYKRATKYLLTEEPGAKREQTKKTEQSLPVAKGGYEHKYKKYKYKYLMLKQIANSSRYP